MISMMSKSIPQNVIKRFNREVDELKIDIYACILIVKILDLWITLFLVEFFDEILWSLSTYYGDHPRQNYLKIQSFTPVKREVRAFIKRIKLFMLPDSIYIVMLLFFSASEASIVIKSYLHHWQQRISSI
ncbi:hypothetical protein LguiB_023494 [Lonicera macranthoides]